MEKQNFIVEMLILSAILIVTGLFSYYQSIVFESLLLEIWSDFTLTTFAKNLIFVFLWGSFITAIIPLGLPGKKEFDLFWIIFQAVAIAFGFYYNIEQTWWVFVVCALPDVFGLIMRKVNKFPNWLSLFFR